MEAIMEGRGDGERVVYGWRPLPMFGRRSLSLSVGRHHTTPHHTPFVRSLGRNAAIAGWRRGGILALSISPLTLFLPLSTPFSLPERKSDLDHGAHEGNGELAGMLYVWALFLCSSYFLFSGEFLSCIKSSASLPSPLVHPPLGGGTDGGEGEREVSWSVAALIDSIQFDLPNKD